MCRLLVGGEGAAEQRHDDRSGNADRRLVDVARDERLVRPVPDVRLERDRAVVSDLDMGEPLASTWSPWSRSW